MDTNRIKKFAIEARNILKTGVRQKLYSLGFNDKGAVPERLMPQLVQGGSLWNGELHTEAFYRQWMSLYHRIEKKGIKEVNEEAAYTWFNRLVAIRILQKNGLCEPVMEYADEARTPCIVNQARMGVYPSMPETERQRLMQLLDDDTKVPEQFALLVTSWCHQNAIIQKCFGTINDYTELLLPANILAEGGFVDMINHTEFITKDDFRSAELIGWLYQFYISERKDEVFAKKGKFDADEIPAATQIFTPNWIVKYMVQNTVGRIYLDNNPWSADEMKPQWKYLVEPSEPTPEDAIYRYSQLEDLKVADLACGSGHILNECFDLLYDLYKSEGVSSNKIIEKIFRNNLTGIDIDVRARQMAQFALLIKACQRDISFADAHIMPNILSMPEPLGDDVKLKDALGVFFAGEDTDEMVAELTECFDLMKDAESLGSIMKFDISDSTRLLISQMIEYWSSREDVPELAEDLMLGMKIIIALTEKYSALVMNPPYMGRGGQNDIIRDYIKLNYAYGTWDLYATFMLLAYDRLSQNGKLGTINMHTWMFLGSFEDLRKYIITHTHIDNMLHLGPHTFDELSGEIVQNTSFVISKHTKSSKGVYYKLVDACNCIEKKKLFLSNTTIFSNIDQNNFKLIEGNPIAYWLSSKWLNIFKENTLSSKVISKAGIVSGNDDYFVKYWFEVNYNELSFQETKPYSKYHFFQKGGPKRKYYGNNEYIVKLKDFWSPHFYNKSIRRGDQDFYFKKGIGWSYTGAPKDKVFRIIENCVCGTGTPALYAKYDKDFNFILSLLNSNIVSYILPIINPSLSLPPGYVIKIPIVTGNESRDNIDNNTEQNISISRTDWDSHETSWDFNRNELLTIDSDTYIANIDWYIEEHHRKTGEYLCIDPAAPETDKIKWCYEQYTQKWDRLFAQLHRNEEELNRQFIDIYGLQDELTPDVPQKEVTILQQGEITFTDDNHYQWNADVVMKQLISYAIGIWMGRYRLDKPGLHIAHPEPTDDELQAYTYNNETVQIDDDGITPILPSAGCPFDDNLASRVADFVRIAFGEEHLMENLNYIEQQLGKSIEDYLLKDFWKDHKKMYQNRPIYWLFSSKKGAFKCLVYMHRMTPYTAERVRAKYLLPYIETLNNKIAEMEARDSNLSTKERRQLDNLRKTVDECNEYHDRLQLLAEDTARTTFDLDDGIVTNYAKYGDVLANIK